MTDLSHIAKRLLKAYVHAMALGYSVEDNEGVYPEVMQAMSWKDAKESASGFKELEAADLIGGYSSHSDLKAIWITPDGIRRAVAEGFVEQRLAWTLWPHDDRAYEEVIAESLGDATDFDWPAADEWREAVAEKLGDDHVERFRFVHIRRDFAVVHGHSVMRTIIDAVILGLSDGPAVYVPVIARLLNLNPVDAVGLRAYVQEMVYDGYVTARDIHRDPYPIRLTERGIEAIIEHRMIPEHLEYLFLPKRAAADGDFSEEIAALRAKAAARYQFIEKAGEIHDRMMVESENIF